jgi:F-type H+-transporting ATPase subunit gamma
MATLESLKRRLDSIGDLQSVVKTMKAMAAVNIRQYEKAAAALDEYSHTVELGLQAVLRQRSETALTVRSASRDRIVALVFGSDQGMCGQLNEQVVGHCLDTLTELKIKTEGRDMIVVGHRAAGRLEDESQPVNDVFPVPSSIDGVTPLIRKLLLQIEGRLDKGGPRPVYLFHSRHLSGASYRPDRMRLLPLDRIWLEKLRQKSWPGPSLPLFSMDRNDLFSVLVRQYLTVSLAAAAVQSLASENASRLAAMQGAEKNIEEQMEDLQRAYHQQRQMAITEELLDIVSGFEALSRTGDGP